MSAAESAAKEAWEEGGVDGDVGGECLGVYRYKKWGGTCTVEVFPMKVRAAMNEWPEKGMRRRAWMGLAEASRQVDKKSLKRIILRLPDAIEADHDARTRTIPPTDRRSDPANRQARLIHLLRHARPRRADPNLPDLDRPLSPRGWRALEKMRRYLEFMEMKPDLVLCSSATRARQTLEPTTRPSRERSSGRC